MNIHDIIPDFSEMSETELEEVIRSTRRSRTTKKEVTLKERPTKAAARTKESVAAALSNISEEQKALLRKLLF